MANYNADTVGAGRAFMDNGGNSTCEYGITTPPIALALADTVNLVRVAGGTTLVELLVWNGDLDTGTTLQFSLGYKPCNTASSTAAVPAYFAAAGQTTWQAAVLGSAPTRYAFVPITFAEDMFIFATVGAAATGVAASPTITALTRGKSVGVNAG